MKATISKFCPVVRALEVVGDKWTLLILRDLLLHKTRRFQDLQESLEGIAPNTLSARLKLLETNGVIDRKLYSEHPPRLEYVLTTKGRHLGPIVMELRAWGTKYPTDEN
jgi:DNA-binding HxlR family transcriptional regulator